MPISLSALQENFIVIMSYHDGHCMTVRNLVPPEFWGGPYRTIAARIYEFLDRYKKAPKDHIADLLADKLDDKANKREAGLYKDILYGIADQQETINIEYVMKQLESFVKRQSLRAIAIDLAKALQKDTDESLEEAEQLMASSRQQTASVFSPGLRLSNSDRVLDFLDSQTHCFPTGIPELDKRGFGPTRKELWLYIAAAKKGKCIAAGEPVLGSDGSYAPIESFSGCTQAMDEKSFKFRRRKAKLKPNGKKPTVKVITRTGRSVRLTGNHPLLTPNGWVHAEKLNVGDKIASPHTLPVFGTKFMSKHEARLLGFMIADGGMSKKYTLTFSKLDYGIVKMFESCVRSFGCKIKQASHNVGDYYISGDTGPNRVYRWLKGHGLTEVKSKDKVIPSDVFKLQKPPLVQFLQALFTCDGSIYDGNTGANFEYSSTSELLIRQIDHLLTRFGIVASTRRRHQMVNGQDYYSWSLVIRGKSQIEEFAKQIGLLGLKGTYLDALVFKYSKTSRRAPYVSNDRKGDIFWDKIVSIEDAGEAETYDLAVDTNHNFVCGNVLVHNTWMLIQLAKMAMLHRLKVCHITLEMSEERSAQRYMQALFAMSKRKEKSIVTKFNRDSLGRLEGFDEKEISPRLSMDDPKIAAKLQRRIKKFGPRLLDNIIIKQFPTGTLSVRQLEAYLDGLENSERFVPDLLIIDYPDLMNIDKNNYRLSIDEIYKQLRGIFVKRNVAGAIVSQGNRSSEKAKHVGSDNVAEAWSKIAHADCVITYNQTTAEKRMNLARLHVSAGRNDEDRITVVISQNYNMGIFAVDSVLMAGANYWPNIPKVGRDGETEEA